MVTALGLLLCVLLSGGCVTITAGELVEESILAATTGEVSLTQIPTEIPTTEVPTAAAPTTAVPTEVQTTAEAAAEEDVSINWDSMQAAEEDPNVLTEEELKEMVEQNPQMADLMVFIGPYAEFFGFAYDAEQDIFYSTQYPIQRIFGFNSLYDSGAAPFGLYYQTQRIRFYYEDREWMVQLWKGQYGVSVGGEIGVYYRYADSTFKHYDAVADEDMVMMGFDLCKNNIPYLQRGPEKHWWLTGFRILDVAVPTQLSMVCYFDWENEKKADAFERGLGNVLLSDIVYMRQGTEFWLSWTL